MIRIFVDKNDEVAAVVEKILGLADSEIVLVIPRESRLGQSVSNFHLLKREADGADKRLLIESIDEEILALSRVSGLEGVHPLFTRERQSSFSDIVPAPAPTISPPTRPSKKTIPKDNQKSIKERVRVPAPVPAPQTESRLASQPLPPTRRSSRRLFLFAGLVGFGLWAGLWFISSVFGRAEVRVSFERTPWNYTGAIVADSHLKQVDPSRKTIPAELFHESKNITKLFPASGRQPVARQARGRVTIYNRYDSSPQVLVAKTRLMTPDGKIFRLDERVVVPGARLNQGTTTASGVEVGVTADKPGQAYNVGPIDRLTIVGFKGTPKYAGFYAVMKNKASGGLVGETAVPTAQDVKAAQDKVTVLLQNSFRPELLRTIPAEFIILGEAKQFEVTKLTVNQATDARGDFAVFGQAAFSAIGWRESDLKTLLAALAVSGQTPLILDKPTIKYLSSQADLKAGRLTVNLAAQGVITAPFAPEEFKTKITGQPLQVIRKTLESLPGFREAKIFIWPPWLTRLPRNINRIVVTVTE